METGLECCLTGIFTVKPKRTISKNRGCVVLWKSPPRQRRIKSPNIMFYASVAVYLCSQHHHVTIEIAAGLPHPSNRGISRRTTYCSINHLAISIIFKWLLVANKYRLATCTVQPFSLTKPYDLKRVLAALCTLQKLRRSHYEAFQEDRGSIPSTLTCEMK